MTGFNALPMPDEAGPDGSAQWAGVAKVLGPPWARFPVITIGFAGMQMLWSIEMAYGEQTPFPTVPMTYKLCSVAIPHLPWPHQIPNGACLRCWTLGWSYRAAYHWYCPKHRLSQSPLS